MARSRESLAEAQLLAEAGHWNTSVSRLYYSCFYAASALLQKHGLSSAKHSGVRSIFNQQFTRSGTVEKEVAAIYNDLFDRRQESDYGPFFVFEAGDVKPWFKDAERFIASIAALTEDGK
jgi:hypothetical protein